MVSSYRLDDKFAIARGVALITRRCAIDTRLVRSLDPEHSQQRAVVAWRNIPQTMVVSVIASTFTRRTFPKFVRNNVLRPLRNLRCFALCPMKFGFLNLFERVSLRVRMRDARDNPTVEYPEARAVHGHARELHVRIQRSHLTVRRIIAVTHSDVS